MQPRRTFPPVVLALIPALLLGLACGADQDPGQVTGSPRAPERAAAAREAQATAAPPGASKQILFGDFHVHTSYSLDAFFTSMPILGGEGAHPPADACDFARHCAALDFFAITDHALELTPSHWAMEKEANRQCDAVSGGQGSVGGQDLVVFHGFEWTQIGATPETHYGHKNVIFRGLAEDEVPARPITSRGMGNLTPWIDVTRPMTRAGLVDPLNASDYADLAWMADAIEAVPRCPEDVPTRELPVDCMEDAARPDVLFRKLDEWGLPSVVIPHGNAWGNYTPPTSSWDKQLAPGMHDPERQTLVEVMSGHGSSEQYANWREFRYDAAGAKVCPEATPDYLPCCRRAGEMMRERCGDLPAEECEARVALAQQYAMDAGTGFGTVFPGSDGADWLDCGQDREGFKPAYALRPQGTVQYALSLSRAQDDGGPPARFRFGLIASSDNHSGRAATGYKQSHARQGVTDMVGPRTALHARVLDLSSEPEDPRMPVAAAPEVASAVSIERSASFLYPGGLVAVHAPSRSRDGIWQAIERREVYGTSGPRILLWLDLLNGAEPAPMGTGIELAEAPRFRVRAAGSFRQKPGCPEDAVSALSPDRIASLCLGECYYPGDERIPIEAIEVVRIRPQQTPDEDVGALIEDPWKRFACDGEASGCQVEFSDEEFPGSGRDAVYYVRALQAPTPAVNGANLRTRFDADGRPTSIRPCQVGANATPGDDCVAEVRERAWSSPIFVDQPRATGEPVMAGAR
jgi:hypothetical protein